jgi:glycosyltransferase involved in cell wall biosynthesis
MLDARSIPLLAGTFLAAAVIPTFLFLRALVRYRRIQLLTPAGGHNASSCMVVIPARNEQDHIERAVRSFPPDTVIVVDDGSQDETAKRARAAGAGVLSAPPLPKGAIGKNHACQAGAAVLDSRWILFTDADTWYPPEFLSSAVACAEASRLDFLSLLLTPEPQTLLGYLLTPYAHALFFAGVSPRRHPSAVFSGQSLLVNRQAYQFVGGHGALLGQLAADVKMAALAERHRMRFGVVRAGSLGYMQFYEDYAGLRSGIGRSAFRFLVLSSWPGVAILLTAVVAALWLPAAALYMLAGYSWGAAFVLLPMLWGAGWYRSWRLVFAPLAVYAMLPILVSATRVALTGSQVAWKGRIV